MTNKPLFLDSFVFIHIAEDNQLATDIMSYIKSNKYTLVIGVMNLIELYKWKKCWEKVSEFISCVPFCIAQNPELIVATEVSKYPNNIELPTNFCSLDHSFSQSELKKAIEVNIRTKISFFENKYRSYYNDVFEDIIKKWSSFPPEENGKYSSFQRFLFLQTSVLNMLLPDHSEFLNRQIANSKEIKIECFKSIYIQALAIFLEYYVQGKDGKKSDVGDFFQLSILPYVSLAVVDNERYDLIQKINRQSLFPDTLQACNLAQFMKNIKN